jgi:hypothetical protein
MVMKKLRQVLLGLLERWAIRRLENRLERVTPPEAAPEEQMPVVSDDDYRADYPMQAHYKPAWIELVMRNIQREEKAKWN